jgi:hypothetical protein
MTERRQPRSVRLLVWAVCTLAGLVGLAYGYDFGQRVGGMLLGMVMALNAAVFFPIVLAGVIEPLLRLLQPRASDRNVNRPQA